MGLFSKLKKSIQTTGEEISLSLSAIFRGKLRIDATTLDELEDELIQADFGIDMAIEIVDLLRKKQVDKQADFQAAVRTHLTEILTEKITPFAQEFTLPKSENNDPIVLLMVGVNGSGKTTTIGKLAVQFSAQGKQVHLAAGDTFRAGAVNQLKVWAERANVTLTTPTKEGADPASTIFKGYTEAKENGADILIADTAGRLQNREDLMAELKKITKILKKHSPTAPHATLLVLDATVGQNALSQVEAFHKIANVTGLVLTKLDSSAKAGITYAITQKYALPIHYIGVGEAIEDLRKFDAREFTQALVSK